MINLVLFGPPGAGKGTQAQKIKEKYDLIHLSTGDILRSELASKTPLGLEAKKYMDKGELVPDQVVIGMIESKINKNMDAKGFIFDGFPRTTEQAKALDKMLEDKDLGISAMLALEVDHDELVKRLLNRAKESGREDDKDETVIENRISVYQKETAPVINYYDAQGKFKSINGVGDINEIFDNICNAIDNI
jgi:adenylate kinase